MIQPIFRAPDEFLEALETCQYCGELIRPGEVIIELREDPWEYIHAACWECKIEDSREDAAENAA
jgi:hypothetical protein